MVKQFPDLERGESASVEDYLAVIRRYKDEFERQEKGNAALQKEIEASKTSIRERMDAHQLRQNHERLKTVYYVIPEDMRREALASLQPKRQRQPRNKGEAR